MPGIYYVHDFDPNEERVLSSINWLRFAASNLARSGLGCELSFEGPMCRTHGPLLRCLEQPFLGQSRDGSGR
jgi:hypothetical protein